MDSTHHSYHATNHLPKIKTKHVTFKEKGAYPFVMNQRLKPWISHIIPSHNTLKESSFLGLKTPSKFPFFLKEEVPFYSQNGSQRLVQRI